MISTANPYGILMTRSTMLSAKEEVLFKDAAVTLFHAPVLQFETWPERIDINLLEGVDYLVFTSEFGAKTAAVFATTLGHIPCMAVGEKTAEAAIKSGFQVVLVGQQGAAALADDIIAHCPANTRLAVMGGDEPAFPLAEKLTASGRPTTHYALYHSAGVTSFPSHVERAFQQGEIQSVFLSSAKGAASWSALMQTHSLTHLLPSLQLYALSPAVAEVVTNLPRLSLYVPPTPRIPLLIDAWLRYNSLL